jgi:hypothetical protein
VADINGDGIPDIVAPSYDSSVYAWSSNGPLLWRHYLEDTLWSSPVVADIDNDGVPEIVLGGDIWAGNPFGVPEGGLVWVLRRDGSTYPGYPRSTPQQTVWSSPAVGDIDGDGNPDIVVGTGTNWADPRGRRVDAFRARDGVNLAGWPVAVDGRVLGSPTLSDMDGDGKLEVTFASDGGWVYAYNSAGIRLWRGCNAGLPDTCRPGYFANGGTVVADVDGDGRQEVISSLDKDVRVFDGLTGNVENTLEINPGNASPQGSSPAVFALGGKAMIAQVSGSPAGGRAGELGAGDATRLILLTTGRDLGRADWPQFHRDAARTGRYRSLVVSKAAKSFVTAAYQDYVGRAPTETELANGLDVVGDASSIQRRSQFTTVLATSDTYLGAVVNKLYVDTLGRTGDPGGVAYWTNQLRTGTVTVAQTAGLFYSSPEYFSGFGNNDLTTWVTDLYQKVLLRAPDQRGLDYYVDLAKRTNRYTVAYPLYQSTESAQTRTKALYQHFLGRPADQGGLDYWASRIPALGDVALASNLTLSDEYLGKAATRYPS